MKTHTPEKKHASEKIRISENTASPERGRETVKDELNAGRRNDGIAGSGSSPDPSMEKSTALRRDENERSAYDGKKAAASGRALPRRQNKNMIMVLIAVCCFIVLIITAVIVTAANRDKFFGENSILRAPGGKPSNSADAVATPGDSSASPDNTFDMTPSGNTPGPASTADPTPLSEELLKKCGGRKACGGKRAF